ncbi:restriction endonuclease [Flavobacterium gillisiae]|nr:restriction endonuclease [Flavobacterium gillisiae]
MKWQEYQEAVGVLYEQMSEMGEVRKNITIPDRVTGQARQVDVWWEFQIGNHTIKILIDAKMRASKLDVKDVEEILALAKSVKADKAIIVTNNEWTSPAQLFANHEGLDFLILTIDEATDLIIDGKWLMCKDCGKDCVVMDSDGAVEIDEKINWWLGGKCRSCRTLHIICQACGAKGMMRINESWSCNCDFEWKNTEEYYEFKIITENDVTEFKDPNQREIDFN